MPIKESGEMYLETILILSRKNNKVRAIDIVDEMGYSKPSVSRALAKLREQEYILVDRGGYIALTESGHEVAEKIYERHTTLAELLMRLGVDEDTAAEDACRIEHDISDKSFAAIKSHVLKYSK